MSEMRSLFCWHEMMSTDPAKSIEFYTKLLDWTTEEMEMGPGGKYTMFKSGGKQVGGVVPIDKGAGKPSHWIGYVTVENIDETVILAQELGGACPVPVTIIPGIGHFAVTSDPQGARISPFQAADPSEVPAPAENDFVWEELMTTEPEAAVDYYGKLFNWTTEPWDMGEGGIYHIMKSGGVGVAGAMKIPAGVEAPPHWISYIGVNDCDAYTAKATKLGAKVCVAPQDIPEVGRFSMIGDPNGAVFALFKPLQP